MSAYQLNKITYCDFGFIDGDVTLSFTSEEDVDLHWDKKTQSYSMSDFFILLDFFHVVILHHLGDCATSISVFQAGEIFEGIAGAPSNVQYTFRLCKGREHQLS